MPQLSVQQLFDDRREKLQLTWVSGQKGASRELTHEALNRPGVGLVGHLNLIHPILMQALGSSDLAYLSNQPPKARAESLNALCAGETLCIFLCDGVDAPDFLIAACDEHSTPLFLSQKQSRVFVNLLRPYLQRELSEVTTSHGVFLDVLGFGTLITGNSQIGKSELALEHLERPTDEYFRELDRLQTKSSTTTILGVEIPTVTLAVVAGRNLAVLVEAGVRNYILQTRGYDSTKDFIDRHEEAMREQTEGVVTESASDRFGDTSAFRAYGTE